MFRYVEKSYWHSNNISLFAGIRHTIEIADVLPIPYSFNNDVLQILITSEY